MDFIINEKIVHDFPNLKIGIFIATNIDNTGNSTKLDFLKEEIACKIRNKYSLQDLEKIQKIKEWREVYTKMGIKLKKYSPTVEALLTRILKNKPIPSISKLVDSYLCIELLHFFPIGGYDLDQITSEITLRRSHGDEDFIPLGQPSVVEKTNENEIVYSSGNTILTRMWNFRDCDNFKITGNSRNIVLFFESTSEDLDISEMEKSLLQLCSFVQEYCGGKSSWFIADPVESHKWSLTIP